MLPDSFIAFKTAVYLIYKSGVLPHGEHTPYPLRRPAGYWLLENNRLNVTAGGKYGYH
jgi:hypothetical protein